MLFVSTMENIMENKLILLVTENNKISDRYCYCLDEAFLLNHGLSNIIDPQINDLLSEWETLQERLLFLFDVLEILIHNNELYNNYNTVGQFYIQELINCIKILRESQKRDYEKFKEIIERYKKF